jgi:small-conductance mechanosensitive channel
VEAQPLARFDRAHFKAYGAASLDFETVYIVQTPDYAVYMDIQQAINVALFERFEQEGIAFAYPAQTVYFANATAS